MPVLGTPKRNKNEQFLSFWYLFRQLLAISGILYRTKKDFRHFQKISSLLSDERFCPKFVFVTHYVYKCISTKHLGKNLICQNISTDKIFVGLNFRRTKLFVVHNFLSSKKFRHFCPTFFLSDKVIIFYKNIAGSNHRNESKASCVYFVLH